MATEKERKALVRIISDMKKRLKKSIKDGEYSAAATQEAYISGLRQAAIVFDNENARAYYADEP